MSKLIEAKSAIAECSLEDQVAVKEYVSRFVPHPLEQEWGIDSDTILGAIRRSSDLTKRGVRGIIAEAVFEKSIAPLIVGSGWKVEEAPSDLSYDALLTNGISRVRVQIKLQRLEQGKPKLYYPKHYSANPFFVVEVQKTRSGEVKIKAPLPGIDTTEESVASVVEKTRPYKFGDFDILAVNMHPSSGDWKKFRYTVASWLLPRRDNPKLIEIFQPVAVEANDLWTENLLTCLQWLLSGETRTVLAEILHTRKPKEERKPKKKKGAKTSLKKKVVQKNLPSS